MCNMSGRSSGRRLLLACRLWRGGRRWCCGGHDGRTERDRRLCERRVRGREIVTVRDGREGSRCEVVRVWRVRERVGESVRGVHSRRDELHVCLFVCAEWGDGGHLDLHGVEGRACSGEGKRGDDVRSAERGRRETRRCEQGGVRVRGGWLTNRHGERDGLRLEVGEGRVGGDERCRRAELVRQGRRRDGRLGRVGEALTAAVSEERRASSRVERVARRAERVRRRRRCRRGRRLVEHADAAVLCDETQVGPLGLLHERLARLTCSCLRSAGREDCGARQRPLALRPSLRELQRQFSSRWTAMRAHPRPPQCAGNSLGIQDRKALFERVDLARVSEEPASPVWLWSGDGRLFERRRGGGELRDGSGSLGEERGREEAGPRRGRELAAECRHQRAVVCVHSSTQHTRTHRRTNKGQRRRTRGSGSKEHQPSGAARRNSRRCTGRGLRTCVCAMDTTPASVSVCVWVERGGEWEEW